MNSYNPVVSLTTHGPRVKSVYLTIESIARNNVKPSRIILWIDNEKTFNTLPTTIANLVKRGLEVRLTENYGPHTKYYPYVLSCNDFTKCLVTADDDMLYSRTWLKELADANRDSPDVIHCHRARVPIISDGKFAPFHMWPFSNIDKPSFCNYLEGVSGVIYPPAFLKVLNKNDDFKNKCPKNDDAWLNATAIWSRTRISQITKASKHYPETFGSKKTGLMHDNLGTFGDKQIAETYHAEDIIFIEKNCHQRGIHNEPE